MEALVVKFSLGANIGGVAAVRSITATPQRGLSHQFFSGNLPIYFNSAK